MGRPKLDVVDPPVLIALRHWALSMKSQYSSLTSPGPTASLHRALHVKAGLGQCAGSAFSFPPSRGRTAGEGRGDRDQWHGPAGASANDVPRSPPGRPLWACPHSGQDAALLDPLA